MNPHIVLDLSRLMWRAARFAPTGIDRVELAYARHLIATARDRLSFTAWWGQMSLLPATEAIAMIAALEAMWAGNMVNLSARSTVQGLVRKLRRHVLLRGEAPLYAYLDRIGEPIVYLLVSHYRLHRPAAIERLKKRTGASLVLLIHDLIPIVHPQYVPKWQTRRHSRRMETVARLANQVIVNSTGTEVALRRHLSANRGTVPIVRASLGLDLLRNKNLSADDAKRSYFVYVGTIEPRKNHALLLDAWDRLRIATGAATPKLLLIGRRGWRGKWIVERIRTSPSLRGLVEEHNGLPDTAVARMVGGACAALYPSFAEGYGLPVAEALALGVPVLCSDLPELREVGQNVPEYLDPCDTAAWSSAISDYTAPQSAARKAQLGRLKSWRPPSWDDHFAIVQPMIDSNGGRATATPITRECHPKENG